MQPRMQRRAKRFEFNEFSRPPRFAQVRRVPRYECTVLLRIQSHSIPKWREPAPTSAFALISPNLKFAKQVSVSSQPYAPWFLQAHFIKCICRCSQLHGKGGSRQCRNSQLPDIWNAQLMSELRYTLIVTSFIRESKVTLDCNIDLFEKTSPQS
jgi:hypothetical protein